MLICIFLSLFGMFFGLLKNNSKYKFNNPKINKSIFWTILIIFSFTSIIMIFRYVQLFITSGGNLVSILINKDQLLIDSGIMGYFYMIGISILLLLPYCNIRRKYKLLIIVFILISYLLYPKRSYFILSLFIVIYDYCTSNKDGINKNFLSNLNIIKLIIVALTFMIVFHYSQVSFNKSVYENNYMNTIGKYNRFEAIFLDTAIYINGNISNSDLYLELYANDKPDLILNNTFYPIYTTLSNFGLIKSEVTLNNYFIKTGDLQTNTINMFVYYYADAGYIYGIFFEFIILLFFWYFSNKKSSLKRVLYPMILYAAIVSFRSNELIMQYFIVNIFFIDHLSHL